MSGATWTTADIPDLTGRTALVTGPTVGGLGFHTALELARHGARVALAGRTSAKLDAAAGAITDEVPGALLEHVVVDLADLASVRAAADDAARLGPIDLLVNNAGIMASPHRRTADGLESQMATNHFGPFLLTGLLLDQVVASGDGRIVNLSSLAHRLAHSAPLGDPRARRRYSRWRVYGQSKLANLLFTFELDRRLRRAGLPVTALAAHPGFAGTHLVVNGQLGTTQGRISSILDAAVRAVSQSAEAGAWPTLMAATADLPGGTYVGPGGPGQASGPPRIVDTTPLARDEVAQRRLWELSEATVGLRWP
ncbi:NAD(P)-dependent dehydrogenase (short-subunit alcohol dehydrogenase family) [Nocardioides cavernae]|uniref:NAD(P)-dependent dehydrogenase (Short-subunit alcohol dehydrogenase family) n=1 Tax=Nocardioides cavernae TaxID=1921566 RepID=A0A7Y9H251_9ACTN|nr:oxidoreductase [Nocardioides cavernae]NYE36560.1 NAD(P)-dependent dehydrogenase (short-subunit alcohol dehydrogenase family) [Nocardioides cavernae]